MKIENLYEEWCGESKHVNDCKPIHDSSEAIDFAEYYHKAIKIDGKEVIERLKVNLKEFKDLLTI